ncbi:MAG: hypothetical protein E7317_06880 [Clostridiales bacterium]|nr:hypothetical protein [Clostridiales bacterium]
MKKKSSISFGPGAASLILIFVVLSMTVLGMLSLMSARNDAVLSDRSLQVINAVYALDARAQETRATLDEVLAEAAKDAQSDEEYLSAIEAQLPDEVEMDGDSLYWTETDDARTLECEIQVMPLGSAQRAEWVRHDLYAETGEVW